MVSLTSLREEIVTILGADEVHTQGYVPSKFVPPGVIVRYGSPYIQPGDAFGKHVVNFQVLIVAGRGTNDKVTKELDDRLVGVLKTLTANNWHVDSVASPTIEPFNNAEYLAVELDVKTPNLKLE